MAFRTLTKRPEEKQDPAPLEAGTPVRLRGVEMPVGHFLCLDNKETASILSTFVLDHSTRTKQS